MVSPVWYNIRRVGVGEYIITGEHDVDVSWMKEVKTHDLRGDVVGRILPRFTFEGWDKSAYQELSQSNEAMNEIIRMIIEQVKYTPHSGSVLIAGNMDMMGLF
jgi:hypothetical protein